MRLQTRFEDAFALLRAKVESGALCGGVLGLADASGYRAIRSTGHAQLTPEMRPMREETLFDLASLTKVIFTTERILDHARAGRIDLDAPVASVIPDLRQYDVDHAWERQITFRDCLGHRTGLPGVFPIYTYGDDPARLRAFVLQKEWTRGENVYSCINFILLGIALERIEGVTLRDMDPGPGFAFSANSDQVAATEFCTWRNRMLNGEVHDENSYALQGAGNAGLFGTAGAVLEFAQKLLSVDGSGSDHTKLLRTALRPTRGHGWELPYPGWSGGDRCSTDTIGHTGFTGTGLWVDFASGYAWTLLTNRVHPSRHVETGILKLRRAVGNAINGRAQ